MLQVVLVAASLAFTSADAERAYTTAGMLVAEHTPRDAGTSNGWLAADAILNAVRETGANVLLDRFSGDTPRGRHDFVNVYAEFKSSDSNSWVVLVSHYDTKPGVDCPGANDGASTSGILVGIADAVSRWRDRRGNLMLVWTDGEECMDAYSPRDGFWGSKRAADVIARRKLRVQAVICLDMLGDRDLSISIPGNGCPSLAKIAVLAASRAGHCGMVKMSDMLVKDDHVAFLNRGFKAIDMIDFSYGPDNSYWHTPQDVMESISVGSLKTSGEIVAEMLNILL